MDKQKTGDSYYLDVSKVIKVNEQWRVFFLANGGKQEVAFKCSPEVEGFLEKIGNIAGQTVVAQFNSFGKLESLEII